MVVTSAAILTSTQIILTEHNTRAKNPFKQNFIMLAYLLFPLLPIAAGAALPARSALERCLSRPGNVTINQYQLYPENSDFDPKRCVAYSR
jgi:hypothetical protein